MKRKLLSILVALFLICTVAFTFTACGDSSDGAPQNKDITGITFVDETYDYDGTEKTLLVTGELPDGVSVSYTNNTGANANVYNASAVLSGQGYNTLTLTAKLTINKINYDMSGAAWDYSEPFTYNGTEKEVKVIGLPNGVTVKSYSNNTKTNAGEYTASVTFNYDSVNYNTPTIANCPWKIDKATISGVSVEEEQSVKHDGEKHLPQITGAIPVGVNTSFEFDGVVKNDGVSAIATYQVKITLSGANYYDKEFNCEFKIKLNAAALASSVIDSFKNVPDPWDFLPESFAAQNRTVSTIHTYENFVNVSNIPQNGIGKQLNVVYGVLNKTSKALSFITPVYSVLNTVKTTFTEFIDKNPESYKEFTVTISGLKLTLVLTETQYAISANVKGVEIIIFADTESKTYGARIQLTETTVLKYTVADEVLSIALNVLDTSSTYLEFARDEDGNLVGMIYEYLTAGDLSIINTSAMITSNETHTTLIGTKGDFIPTSVSRNCEVYLNSTGCLVGTEVREEMEKPFKATYNTLWYNLSSISGINSIKKVDEASGTNADTIYINGYTNDHIHTALVGTDNYKKGASRRFDIEFKTMYFYQYNQAKEEYEEVKMEIPMMFIQEEYVDSFEELFKEKNPNSVTSTVSLNVSSTTKNAVAFGYYTLLEEYDKLMNAVTQEDIINFCK